jgi:hypothetical protein
MNYYVVSKFQESKLKYGVISTNGKLIVPFGYDYIEIDNNNFVCCRENKWGVLNKKLQEIVEFKYDFISVNYSYFIVNQNNLVGLFTSEGLEIIPVNFDDIKFSKSDYFITTKKEKVGVYSKQGVLVPNEYDEIRNVKLGFLARIKDKWGLLDNENSILIQFKYKSIGDSDNKGICVAKENNKFGYIDLNGNWVIRPLFDEAEMFDANDRATVKVGYYSGLIDRNGCWVIAADAQSIKLIDNVYVVKKYGILNKETYYDSNGIAIDLKDNFFKIDFDKNGFQPFSVESKSGLKDEKGNIVISANYDYIISINKKLFICYLKGKMGLLNSEETWLLEPNFETYSWQIIEGKGVYVKSNDDSYFFDFKKNTKIRFNDEYELGHFDHDGFVITKANSGKYGLLFCNGEWKIPPIYDKINDKDINGLIKASIDGKYGWIDMNGNWLIQPDFDNYSRNQEDSNDIDFDDEILENILVKIDETFDEDNESVYFENQITKEQKKFFKSFQFNELRHLLFINDNYKESKTISGILLCEENGSFYIVLIEGCSKPVKIRLGSTLSSDTLRHINYSPNTNVLTVEFDKEFSLDCSWKKISYKDFEPEHNDYLFYFYNNEAISKFCEMIYDIINELFVQEQF